jgi:hypothetical protein
MKRVFSLILAAAIIITLAACQVTPEKPVVIQKDTERMVEQAKNADKGTKLADLKLPEGNYKFSATGADGRLTIKADAPISIPKAAKLPMVRVEAGTFTQEQVTKFFNRLFPDKKPTYTENAKEMGMMTKDDIRNKIVFYKKLIADKTIAEKSIFADAEEVNKEIKKLEKQLPSAPDRLPAPQIKTSDGTLQKAKAGEYFENKLVKEEDIYKISASLGDIGITITTPATPHQDTEAYMIYWDTGGPGYSEANAIAYDKSNLPKGAKDKLKISFDKAKSLCEGFFAAGGIKDITLRDVSIIDDERFGDSDGVIAPAEHYAYCFNYCRKTAGLPVYSATEAGGPGGSGDANALPWRYESIYFYVDNNGIRTMRWYSPTQLGETINQDVNILPFKDIQAIFEEMILRVYEPQAKTDPQSGLTDAKLDINIRSVELMLVRVREQNTEGRKGIYTPAWIYYGNTRQDKKYEGQKLGTSYDGGSPQPLLKNPILVINAVDGSIIDLSKGY